MLPATCTPLPAILKESMSSRLQIAVLTLFVPLLLAPIASAQSEISVQPPTGGLGWLTHPYQASSVPAHPFDQLAALQRSDPGRKLVSDGAGRGRAGDRKQHRRRSAALWAAARSASAAARRGRRSFAKRRTGRGRGPGKRQPAGRQRQQLRIGRALGRQRREFGRRHRDAVGSQHPLARSFVIRVRKFPARYRAPKQYFADRHHRSDPERTEHSGAVLAELGIRFDRAGHLCQQLLFTSTARCSA